MNNVALITGYLASLLLAISLLVNNDVKFRWFNIFACISFIIYGLIIKAFPVTLTNSILLVINVVRLAQLYSKKEYFQIIEVSGNDPLLKSFLTFYSADIKKYFPRFNASDTDNNLYLIVLRNMEIASAFIAKMDNGNAMVKLDYTVSKYRDYKIGRFIFDTDRAFLMSKGITTLSYDQVDNKRHGSFIKRMGFESTASGQYIKEL
jgi:hypothetical protein